MCLHGTLYFTPFNLICNMTICRETALIPPVKYFTDGSQAVLLLWIIYVSLPCVCYAFVHVCLFVPCGHLLGNC